MQYPRYAQLIVAATVSLWLQSCSAETESPPGRAGPVDLLAAFRLNSNPAVEKVNGICSRREGQYPPDTAYRLTQQAVISVPTASVFPDGFPFDFSILSVFRSSGAERGELFTIYNADGSLALSVKIAKRILLVYKGEGRGRKSRLRFQFKLTDGDWQKLGISVKGNSVTAILNCQEQDTKSIRRKKEELKRTESFYMDRKLTANHILTERFNYCS